MLLEEVALVASIGLNILTCLVLANQRRKGNVAMTANADALNSLASDVQNESSVVDSAIVLINGFANRLTDILSQHSSPEDLTTQIQALRDEINGRAVALGQAVAAGTAAENDSSNFPADTGGSVTGSSPSTGETSSDISAGSTTESASSQPTSSDSVSSSDTSDSETSGEASSSLSGSDATPAPDTSAESGQPQSPAGDGTADVADPSVADLPPTEDSPPAIETPGDEVVAPDSGESTPPSE
jgi:hypothetical protein